MQSSIRKEAKMPEFKVILLGEARVGKSSIILRFLKNQFDPDSKPTTLGPDQAFSEKIMQTFNGNKVKINLWDTAGQEIFSSIVSMYYKQARAAVIVFDLTDRETIKKARKWIMEVRENTETYNCKIILVGNKQDKANERQISTKEAQAIASEFNIKYYETSAKSSFNVKEVFQDLSEELFAENRNTTKRPTRIEIQNDNFSKEEKNGKSKKYNDQSKSGGCC